MATMAAERAEAVAGTLSLPVAASAWHALLWLLIANAIGVLLAVLLLFPSLNGLLGEWTYGRWMMVHMNLELYGWASLPLAGFLFHAYGADSGAAAAWCRPALWAWSAALVAGSLSWLNGHSSGKLFLDWSGYARLLFPCALLALWGVLLAAVAAPGRSPRKTAGAVVAARILGLAALLAVPFALYAASGPAIYPAVNPDTGGPTGASQLESSLAVEAILLVLPLGLARRSSSGRAWFAAAWILLAAEGALSIAMGQGNTSHHSPLQYLGVGSLLLWLPLTPLYYRCFEWHAGTRLWRIGFLSWWGALLVSGWIFFLPGVLDRFKFTDGLVGHSFVAMAGFASSLLIFVLVELLGPGGWIFSGRRSFLLWNGAVLAYVMVVTWAGWRESADPAFTIVPGAARNLLYVLRLATGVLMLAASVDWFLAATALLAGFSSPRQRPA